MVARSGSYPSLPSERRDASVRSSVTFRGKGLHRVYLPPDRWDGGDPGDVSVAPWHTECCRPSRPSSSHRHRGSRRAPSLACADARLPVSRGSLRGGRRGAAPEAGDPATRIPEPPSRPHDRRQHAAARRARARDGRRARYRLRRRRRPHRRSGRWRSHDLGRRAARASAVSTRRWSSASAGSSTVLSRLVDSGNTVLLIEHKLDVIKSADHVVDLGPEGGDGERRSSHQGRRRT